MGPRVFWFWFWFQSSGFVSWFWFRAGPESMKLLLLHALREGRGLHHVREGGGVNGRSSRLGTATEPPPQSAPLLTPRGHSCG